MASFDGWFFLAGLSLFVFALVLVEESLKSLAGRPFKKFLQAQTAHKARALLGSAAITGILQSSSVVLLITLSFVGAGIMSMRNALAVVLGANLGTTFDSWVIAWLGFRYDIEQFSYPLMAVSLVSSLFFSRKRTVALWSRFFMGIGLLFIGLSYMKSTLADAEAIAVLEGFTGGSPYFFIVIGFLLTAIIQSSFAAMAVALSALSAGLLPIEHAAGVVVGSELGTAIKLIIGASGKSVDKKRVAWGNIVFNLFTVLLGAVLLVPFIRFIQREWFGDPLLALVAFQSALNALTIFTFYPLLGRLARFLENSIADSHKKDPFMSIELLPPAAGVSAIDQQVQLLVNRMVTLNRKALGITSEHVGVPLPLLVRWQRWFRSGATFTDDYGALKQFHGELLEAASDLLQEDLPPAEAERLSQLLIASRNILHAAKNVKDIRHNLKELNDSANDNLYSALLAIREKESEFYSTVESRLGEKVTSDEGPLTLTENNREQEHYVQRTMDLLHHHQIKEFEAATLVNVYRELHSSHKAIIKAMVVLAAPQREEQSSTFQAV